MEEKILQKIEEQNEKINDMSQELAKLSKYFRMVFWITIALFVLPLLAALFIIPAFLNTYLGSLDGLI